MLIQSASTDPERHTCSENPKTDFVKSIICEPKSGCFCLKRDSSYLKKTHQRCTTTYTHTKCHVGSLLEISSVRRSQNPLYLLLQKWMTRTYIRQINGVPPNTHRRKMSIRIWLEILFAPQSGYLYL